LRVFRFDVETGIHFDAEDAVMLVSDSVDWYVETREYLATCMSSGGWRLTRNDSSVNEILCFTSIVSRVVVELDRRSTVSNLNRLFANSFEGFRDEVCDNEELEGKKKRGGSELF
jgi:sulfur transfer complex TusBCD TusB component (DsrH family)